ncbi:hypothetical protein LL037_15165 [Clostridium estertheticum]|uniref:Lipoprotein n=1 Tax=Clostridium estertheticum TaxID=238834 RepID=A0AA47I6Y7_9CLOT|nr:hypothetical protein [Clostridium estertheticum]MBU3154503.1 hypothetical protein [Clostridium estertheticum]MBU3201282.1 hypothetical protein [Clostridium estertheticum]WAG62062.1 hypothetical protein LL038_07410 [Clostridium estertheticum]WAG63815.1 hypothetical protein LL037_15165 [Clostridium estertheticum]
MKKKYSIMVLMALNTLILLSGCIFIVYSIYFKITFKVINTNIPGAIIGLTVLYFSARYYKMILKLKGEINEKGNSFSWANFKRMKKE